MDCRALGKKYSITLYLGIIPYASYFLTHAVHGAMAAAKNALSFGATSSCQRSLTLLIQYLSYNTLSNLLM